MAAAPDTGTSQWRTWMNLDRKLLSTPEKAVDFAEAVVRAAFGPEQVEEERPFIAEDFGDEWRVTGTRLGSHALPLPVSSHIVLNKLTGNVMNYQLTQPWDPKLAEQWKALPRPAAP